MTEAEGEHGRHFVEEARILARMMLLLQPQLTGLLLSERARGRFPLASGSWTEGMRLSSRPATRLLMGPAELHIQSAIMFLSPYARTQPWTPSG